MSSKEEFNNLINFYKKNGLLIEYESLVSCTASEAYMLSDHVKATNYLNYVYINLPDLSNINLSSLNESLFQMDFEKYVEKGLLILNALKILLFY
jgi:hypothetical protein